MRNHEPDHPISSTRPISLGQPTSSPRHHTPHTTHTHTHTHPSTDTPTPQRTRTPPLALASHDGILHDGPTTTQLGSSSSSSDGGHDVDLHASPPKHHRHHHQMVATTSICTRRPHGSCAAIDTDNAGCGGEPCAKNSSYLW